MRHQRTGSGTREGAREEGTERVVTFLIGLRTSKTDKSIGRVSVSVRSTDRSMRNLDESESVYMIGLANAVASRLFSDEKIRLSLSFVVEGRSSTYFRRQRLDPNGLNLKGFIMAGSHPGEE